MDPSSQPAVKTTAKGCLELAIFGVVLFFSAFPASAAEVRVGKFHESTTVVQIAGAKWARNFESMVEPDAEIEWSVRVPENYTADSPPGLVVYISPSDSGKIPRQWESVMTERNLIWVAANRSGNRVDPRLRITYSLLAPMFIGKNYKIDLRRVYVAGLSGGGRVASIVAPEYATLFRGAIYICGVNKLNGNSVEKLAQLQSNRFVFLTGDKDFNRRETKRVFNAYRRLGIESALYLQIDNMGHENPDAAGFADAIAYLDGS